jgi:small subunit ribosomal protein S17
MAEKKKAEMKKVVSPKAKPVVAKKVVVKAPTCSDANCPMHGKVRMHGRVFEGTVVSDKMQLTVTVQWPRQRYVPKYERYFKTRSKIKAHNSPCVAAKAGDKVRIAECRPISKTVNFVVMEVLNETN